MLGRQRRSVTREALKKEVRWGCAVKQGLLLSLVMVLLTSGCGIGQSKNEAQLIAERYFEAAQRGDNQAVLSLYDEPFYTVTPRPKWSDMYSGIVRKLGKPTKHDLST